MFDKNKIVSLPAGGVVQIDLDLNVPPKTKINGFKVRARAETRRSKKSKISLTSTGFKRELEFMLRKEDISEPLYFAMYSLIEIFLAKREFPISDFPILDKEIVSFVRRHTDEGLFFLDERPFRLGALKSKDPEVHPSHLTMVSVKCPRYQLYRI